MLAGIVRAGMQDAGADADGECIFSVSGDGKVPVTTRVGYAKRAWDTESSTWVDISIEHMTIEEAHFWDRYIQPDIRAIAAEEMATLKPLTRADHHWKWVQIRMALPLAQSLVGRRCRALTIMLENSAGKGVPAGMLLLIEDYPWLFRTPWRLGNVFSRQSTFTWFLASAPKKTLGRLGVPKTPSLLRTLIDTALVTSISLGHSGRMWLHAAPNGGQILFDLYSRKCKLMNAPSGKRVPKMSRRIVSIPSDGRHFYATPSLARQLVNELKDTRDS